MRREPRPARPSGGPPCPPREAVELLCDRGDDLLPELARALQVLGTHLERCGDDEGAVEAFREAVALHRSLALETPAAHRKPCSPLSSPPWTTWAGVSPVPANTRR
ncbi:hypothetical protein [Streptomyces badius]|uniref:Tetratricopeptide repeat protein n=1 Tax=Streptomyces badius TaxID=1941 RepID=A0ABQ2SPV6_STRBA|nr:hypothetical protein [Streptomyces badius]GGS34600.1 hypothetical protein GCM10010253_05190 [Streptomyces badius]